MAALRNVWEQHHQPGANKRSLLTWSPGQVRGCGRSLGSSRSRGRGGPGRRTPQGLHRPWESARSLISHHARPALTHPHCPRRCRRAWAPSSSSWPTSTARTGPPSSPPRGSCPVRRRCPPPCRLVALPPCRSPCPAPLRTAASRPSAAPPAPFQPSSVRTVTCRFPASPYLHFRPATTHLMTPPTPQPPPPNCCRLQLVQPGRV